MQMFALQLFEIAYFRFASRYILSAVQLTQSLPLRGFLAQPEREPVVFILGGAAWGPWAQAPPEFWQQVA